MVRSKFVPWSISLIFSHALCIVIYILSRKRKTLKKKKKKWKQDLDFSILDIRRIKKKEGGGSANPIILLINY